MADVMAGRLGTVALLFAVCAGTAFAAAGDPEKRAYNAADQALAKRANLTIADLPHDFVHGPSVGGGDNTGLTCARFAPDLSSYTITGQATSPSFVRANGTSIFSASEIFRSAADARGDWRKSARRAALPCVAQMLQRQSTGSVRIRVTSSTVRRAPRVGERAISFRIAARASANGMSVPAWFDILAVGRGRGDATLAVIAFGTPPSASLERSLLAKLAARLPR
jgi:hypothetical protein